MHLEEIRKRAGLTQGRLANMAGVQQATISRIERGSSSVTLRTLMDIAAALDVSIGEFFNTAPPSATPHPSVPRYDIRLSAGAGSVNYEDAEILDHIPFTDEFLTRKLNRSNKDGLICCDVHGNSMAPTLNDGDLVILDVQQVRDRKPAGIYAVTYGKESFVKRVEKVDTGYTLLSDNPAYIPIHVRGDEVSRLHFVGKVIWSGGVMR